MSWRADDMVGQLFACAHVTYRNKKKKRKTHMGNNTLEVTQSCEDEIDIQTITLLGSVTSTLKSVSCAASLNHEKIFIKIGRIAPDEIKYTTFFAQKEIGPQKYFCTTNENFLSKLIEKFQEHLQKSADPPIDMLTNFINEVKPDRMPINDTENKVGPKPDHILCALGMKAYDRDLLVWAQDSKPQQEVLKKMEENVEKLIDNMLDTGKAIFDFKPQNIVVNGKKGISIDEMKLIDFDEVVELDNLLEEKELIKYILICSFLSQYPHENHKIFRDYIKNNQQNIVKVVDTVTNLEHFTYPLYYMDCANTFYKEQSQQKQECKYDEVANNASKYDEVANNASKIIEEYTTNYLQHNKDEVHEI